jgi:hypothetical protein
MGTSAKPTTSDYEERKALRATLDAVDIGIAVIRRCRQHPDLQ